MNWKQKMLELKHQRAEKLKAANGLLEKKDMTAWKAAMDEVDGLNDEIDACEKQLAEQDRFSQGDGAGKGMTPGTDDDEKTGYQKAVKAFAAAARNGFRVGKAAGSMMSEGEGADGGYTVPEDIVTRIEQLRDADESLLREVRVVPVTTRSGRRTFKKRGQHTGFTTVAEAGKFGKSSTPQYSTLSYEIEKRGGYLPVTNELLEDSDNNIAAEAESWLASEARVTANKEILDVVKAQSAKTFKSLDDIIKAWIGLGSAFRSSSKLITNDDGLAWLGTLKDANGRYLLSPNPAEPARLQLCVGPHVLPVQTYDNSTIPSDTTKVPVILGDLTEGVVYWDRRQYSVKVSDVAVVGDLNAFEQDLTIWRGSMRDDCTLRDDAAFVYGTIDVVDP